MATRQQRKAVLDAQIMACRRCKGMNRLAKLLDASLKIVCFAKEEVFITNGVHGHPPRNHESLPTWIENCSSYLHRELEIVQPTLVIGLGRDASLHCGPLMSRREC
jgi:uracil-DNA glycosylase family 4